MLTGKEDRSSWVLQKVACHPLYPRLLFISKGINRHRKSMFWETPVSGKVSPNPKNNAEDLLYDTKVWLGWGYPIAVVCSQRIQSRVLGFLTVWISLGHLQQGPLKLFKESWLDQMNDSQSVITHISDVCERLKVANELAKESEIFPGEIEVMVWPDSQSLSLSTWRCFRLYMASHCKHVTMACILQNRRLAKWIMW